MKSRTALVGVVTVVVGAGVTFTPHPAAPPVPTPPTLLRLAVAAAAPPTPAARPTPAVAALPRVAAQAPGSRLFPTTITLRHRNVIHRTPTRFITATTTFAPTPPRHRASTTAPRHVTLDVAAADDPIGAFIAVFISDGDEPSKTAAS